MAIQAICALPNLELFAISIAGAYLLSTSLLLVATAKHLSSIELKACPNLRSDLCKALECNFSSTGSGTLLELLLKNLKLSKEDLMSLSDTDAVRNLKSLTLRQIDTAVDDEVVTQLLEKLGSNLEGIDLSFCFQITDASLSAI